jgi:hypothetical protein
MHQNKPSKCIYLRSFREDFTFSAIRISGHWRPSPRDPSLLFHRWVLYTRSVILTMINVLHSANCGESDDFVGLGGSSAASWLVPFDS